MVEWGNSGIVMGWKQGSGARRWWHWEQGRKWDGFARARKKEGNGESEILVKKVEYEDKN